MLSLAYEHGCLYKGGSFGTTGKNRNPLAQTFLGEKLAKKRGVNVAGLESDGEVAKNVHKQFPLLLSQV